jgi:hypothetical protein
MPSLCCSTSGFKRLQPAVQVASRWLKVADFIVEAPAMSRIVDLLGS